METEEEENRIRTYSRFDRLIRLGSTNKYMRGLNYLLMKRGNLGKFELDEEDGEQS